MLASPEKASPFCKILNANFERLTGAGAPTIQSSPKKCIRRHFLQLDQSRREGRSSWQRQEDEARQYFKSLITTAEQTIKLAGSTGGSRQQPWTASLHIAAVVAC